MTAVLGLRATALTDPGLERTNNEDAVLANGTLLAVADGVGGQEHGERASGTAIEALLALGPDPDPAAVPRAFAAVNDELRARNAEDGTSMGTTCTAVVVRDGRAHVTHIGDSRAYLLRNDALTRLTKDHALLAQLVDAGLMTEEQASHDDRRNVILRALGAGSHAEVDHFSVPLWDGDRILLSTDGLHGYVPDTAIRDALAAAASAGPAAADLVALANDAGGHDNVGVVVADYGPAATAPPTPAEPTEDVIDPELAALGALAAAGLAAEAGAAGPAAAPDEPADLARYEPGPAADALFLDDVDLPTRPSPIPLVIGAVAAVLMIAVIIATLVLTSSAATPAG